MAEPVIIIRTPKTDELVALIYRLDAELAEKKKLLDAAKLRLILHGAPDDIAVKVCDGIELTEAERVELSAACTAKYADADDRKISVIVPTTGGVELDLYPKDQYKAWLTAKGVKKGSATLLREWRAEREQEARDIAGEHFRTLFDYFTAYIPLKNYADFAEKALTKGAFKKLKSLIETKTAPASPHVKLEKPKAEKTDE